jgi:hypothetical protein
MKRLDAVCGALNWKREHLNDNANCIVSIWCEDKKQWVSKEDTGTESNTEKEKGLASDSFKRACFNWGIGRELYDYPVIQVKLNDDEFDKSTGKSTWNFKLKLWKWESEFVDGKITFLSCKDQNNKVRYTFGKGAEETSEDQTKQFLKDVKAKIVMTPDIEKKVIAAMKDQKPCMIGSLTFKTNEAILEYVKEKYDIDENTMLNLTLEK